MGMAGLFLEGIEAKSRRWEYGCVDQFPYG